MHIHRDTHTHTYIYVNLYNSFPDPLKGSGNEHVMTFHKMGFVDVYKG